MIERSLFSTEIGKITLSRNLIKLCLLLGDLGGATLIAWLVRKFLPPLPHPNYILQIWLLTVTVVWLLTYDMDKNFRLDSYLTYTRVLKIAWWAGIGYLLFFVLTRDLYSLRF